MLDRHLDSLMDYLSRRIKLETDCFCITISSAAMDVRNMKAKTVHLQKYWTPGWGEGAIVEILTIQSRDRVWMPRPLVNA